MNHQMEGAVRAHLGATGAGEDRGGRRLAPVVLELQEQGVTMQAAIAAELDARQLPAPDGGTLWHQPKVSRFLRRIKALT